jgi:hypothetical protein
LYHRSKWSGGFFIYNATKMRGSKIWWRMYSYDRFNVYSFDR